MALEAIPTSKLAWLDTQEDKNRVLVINRACERFHVATMRLCAYQALTKDLNLRKRLQSPEFNAPVNLICYSLISNLNVAMVAMHDQKQRDAIDLCKIAKALDGKFKESALNHFKKFCPTYDVTADFQKLKRLAMRFATESFQRTITEIKNYRDNELAHYSRKDFPAHLNTDFKHIRKVFAISANILLTIRRLHVENAVDNYVLDHFVGRPQWQARHLAASIQPAASTTQISRERLPISKWV